MRKLFVGLLVAAFVMLAVPQQAEALYGLNKWYLAVVDEHEKLITDTITVNIYTAGTTTSATIYSDSVATAKSNSWDITDGKIEFWSSATSLDLLVNTGARYAEKAGITVVSTHQVVIRMQAYDVEKVLPLPLGVWYDSTGGDVIDNGEAPGSSVQNSIVAIDWADGQAAEFAAATFRVPSDYYSSGSFRVWMDSTGGGLGAVALDFAVYVNQDVTAFDAAATDQTPVACDQNPGSPSEHTLTVVTDFASLVAGDLVTIRVWRDDTTYTATYGLELYYAEFVYTARQ